MHRWIKKEENEWGGGGQRCRDEVKEGERQRMRAVGVAADGRN